MQTDLAPIPTRSSPAISSADLLTHGRGRADWLVDQRLPLPGTSVLAGVPGIGKRALARDLALAAARGTPWLGFPVAKGPVLYVRLAGFSGLQPLFSQGGLTAEDPIYFVDAERPGGRMERIRDYAKSLSPVLIVIDGLDALRQDDAHRGSNLSDPSELVLDRILDAARDTGAHLLLIHDLVDNLASDLSSFVSASDRSLDAMLMLSRNGGERVLRTVQRRGLDLLDGIRLPASDTCSGEAQDDVENQILAYLRRSRRLAQRKEIAEHVTGPSPSDTYGVINDLYARGDLIRTGHGTRADPYRFTGFDRASGTRRPQWLRRVKPWARVGSGSQPALHWPNDRSDA